MPELCRYRGTTGIDTQTLLSSSSVTQTIIRNCQFFGLFARDMLIRIENTDALFENNQFEGSVGNIGLIYANDFKGLTVRNTTFIDYANFGSQYLTKTPLVLTPA